MVGSVIAVECLLGPSSFGQDRMTLLWKCAAWGVGCMEGPGSLWTPSQCLQATLFLFNVSSYKNGQCLGLFFWETSSVEALETGNLGECNRFGKGS